MMKLFLKSRLFVLLVLLSTFSLPSYGQIVITQTQDLSFGTFSMGSFFSTARINIRNNGSFTTNANTVVIVNPTRAEFDLSGGPPNSTYTVTTPSDYTLTGPGGTITIDNIRVRPNNLRTNGSGFDQFRIAARLTTLGGGVVYGNGIYAGSMDIIVAF